MATSTGQDMDILIIGAAKPPSEEGDERELRMWHGVFSDIKSIYEFCQNPSFSKSSSGGVKESHVNVFQTLINWNTELDQSLVPPPGFMSNSEANREYPSLQQYQSKKQARDGVRRFLQDAAGPNLMIYFSGHGLQETNTVDDILSEVLYLPVNASDGSGSASASNGDMEKYTASELTIDINDSLRQRRGDNADGRGDEHSGQEEQEALTVYLVIDACHAEGLVNFYELVKEVRMDEHTAIILFAGAEARLKSSYDQNGGVFTRSFCRRAVERKGQPVSAIAEGILEDIFDSKIPTSPCVRYSRPKLSTQLFLA